MGCGSSDSEQPVIGGQDGIVRSESVAVSELLMCDDGLSNPLEIHFACQSLPNLDFGSKTDPFVILYIKEATGDGKWVEVGRTEQIRDSLNPVFVRQITIKYQFEVRQFLKVEVWDCDDPTTKNLNNQELVGICELSVAELVRTKSKTLPLTNPRVKKNGTVTLTADQIKDRLSSNIVKLQVGGSGFSRSRLMFFKLHRGSSAGSPMVPVYQSEAAKGNAAGNISWKPVRIGAAALMRDQPTWPLKLELLECVYNGDHKVVEQRNLTFNDLIDNNFVTSGGFGRLYIKGVELVHRVSFTEYLMAGTNIMMAISVDFTASNMPPTHPNSLHCLDMNKNQYIRAIHSVGGILQMYDSDKNIPVYGFGGVIPALGPHASHLFALNGNIFAPEVYTIDNVEKLYMQNLHRLSLNGPTNFAPTIKHIADMAQFYITSGQMYNYIVLMIITDGDITDMDETVDAIILCSTLPISIVIVGVGSSSFENMDILDADRGKLKSKRTGLSAARDIVQFVPLSRFASDSTELAKATLAEIPGQLTEYMSMAKVPPLAMQGPAPMGPSFSATRAAKLQQVLESRGIPGANVAALLGTTGFPVEDPVAISRAIGQPFVNPLALQ